MAITGIGYGNLYRDYFDGTDNLSADIAKTGAGFAGNTVNGDSIADAAIADTGAASELASASKQQAVTVADSGATDGNSQSDTGNRNEPSEKIENLVFDFKRNNNFNLVGASNEIEDVDVDKALSEMQKDSVLSQYKFFVRPNMGTDQDGTVRQVIRGL